MLRSTPEWEAFEREAIRREPKGWHQNIGDFEMLVLHAEEMGALPLSNPLEGIEDDIRLAAALQTRLPSRAAHGPGRAGVPRR